ncbi:hypothetical protein EBZ39_06510 [bacterium]|nr:hypothetical protein [bacterium]
MRDDLARRRFNLATDQIHCIGKENLSARESSALKGKYLANLIRTSDYAKVFYIDTDLRALRAASQAWQEASADGKEVIFIHSTEPQGEFALKLYPSEKYRSYVALILFAEHIRTASKAAPSSSSGAYKIPSFYDLVSGLSSDEDIIVSGAVHLEHLEQTVKDRLYRFFERNWPLVLEQEGISYQPSHTAPMPVAHAGPA